MWFMTAPTRAAPTRTAHRRVLWDNHRAPVTDPAAQLDANHAAAEWARHRNEATR